MLGQEQLSSEDEEGEAEGERADIGGPLKKKQKIKETRPRSERLYEVCRGQVLCSVERGSVHDMCGRQVCGE